MDSVARLKIEIQAEIDKAQQDLKTLKGSIEGVKDETIKAEKGFKGFGITQAVVLGGMVALASQIKKTADKTADMAIKVGDLSDKMGITTQAASRLMGVKVFTPEQVQAARDYEKAMKDFGEKIDGITYSLGNNFIPAITALLDPMYNAKQLAKEGADEIHRMSEEYKNAPPYVQQYMGAIVQNAEKIMDAKSGQEDYNRELMHTIRYYVDLTAATKAAAAVQPIYAREAKKAAMANSQAGRDADWYAQQLEKLAEIEPVYAKEARKAALATHAQGKAADYARANLGRMFSRVDLGIDTTIANLFDKIKYLAAGGDALSAAIQHILDNIEKGIPPATGELEALYIKAELLQIKLKNITPYEAAVNIQENLEIPFWKAWKIVNDIRYQLDYLQGLRVDTRVSIWETVYHREMPWQSGYTGGGGGPHHKQSGGPVEKGYPYIVGERGPELFVPASGGNIRPNSQLGKGGSQNITININGANNASPYQTKEAVKRGILEAARAMGRA